MDLDLDLDIQQTDISANVVNGMRFGMNKVRNVAKELIPLIETETEREGIILGLERHMLKLIRSELNYLQMSKITDEVATEMAEKEAQDEDALIKNVENISTLSRQRLTEYNDTLSDEDLKKHSYFTKLKEEIELAIAEAEANNEDEVEDLEKGNDREMIPIYDPITKQLLTDPIRNSICNHIYGKSSIVELIRNNPKKKVRCPTMGCTNSNFIDASHLVYDPKLVAKVRKKQREVKRQAEEEGNEKSRGSRTPRASTSKKRNN